MSRYIRYLAIIAVALAGMLGSAGASLAAPQSDSQANVAVAQGTGTVSASVYTCPGQSGVIWGGDPSGCAPASANLTFYLHGDGTDDSWALNVNGSASRSLTAGHYDVWESNYWSSSTLDIAAGGTTYLTLLLPGAAAPPPPPPPPPPAQTGTVSAGIYYCDGQDDIVWGAAPGSNCYLANASLVLYLKGDGLDTYWSVTSGSTGTVPAGTHEVYENIHWSMQTIDVAAGTTTYITVLLPGKPLPPPPPATGTVTMNKYICDGITKVTWGGSPDANCDPAKATFYFYLIGDGTDEYWTLSVNGSGSRSLAAGTYEVYEGGTWSMGKVTVTAGQTTTVNVLNPGKPLPPPPPPASGTVKINKYICNGIETVTWGGSPDGNCSPSKATFYFYLIGDGSDEYWSLSVNGSGSRSLAPGTYEVWEDGHWTMGKITIESNKTTEVNVLNPGKPLPKVGYVEVSKYACEGIDAIVWGGSPDANCDPAKATFYFYLVGDGTDQYWALTVNNTSTITLAPGTYEVWEGYGGDWSMHKITVKAGETVKISVLNPAD